jgi:hypothetical protein
MPYFDRNTNDIVAQGVVEALALETKATPYMVAKELGLVLVYPGDGLKNAVGCECKYCGAPMGSIDPDACRWVRESVCSDCRED